MSHGAGGLTTGTPQAPQPHRTGAPVGQTAMFDNLRNAFREAIDNFQKELSRDAIPENVDKLLKGMIDEVADAKVRLKELEDQLAQATREAEAEKKNAMTAVRRGEMAEKIGDAETVEVARKFAEKHARRQIVFEQKATAMAEELTFRTGEIEDMMKAIKEARAKRATLAATAGRTGARESLGAADDLFAELDRMADKVGDEEARSDAAETMTDLNDSFDMHVDPDAPMPEPDVDFDARLAELKRRMGQE